MAETHALARREFLLRTVRAAGLVGPTLALLESRVSALEKSEATDLEVLYAALTLEHHAIALYEEGLKRNLFPAGLRSYAVDFRGDHLGHRDTQIAIARERGGRPPEALKHYDFGPLASGDHLLREAMRIELAAQDAYRALISEIRSKDYMLAAAFVLVDEVRHLTVWRRVLGMKLY